jgi:hypothetical protein
MNSESKIGLLEPEDDLSQPLSAHEELGSVEFSEQNSARRPKQRIVVAALVISIVGLLGTLAWPMLAGQVYTADDLGWFHLPMRSFYSQQLARGEAFDWSPDLYCGFYLTGEGQVGSYHPLHWLLYRTMPLSVAFNLECWLSYPVMLVGMFFFLRRWKLNRQAATFAAMVFTFGSFNLMHLIHVNAVAIVAHLPWLLWAIDIMLRPSAEATSESQSKATRRLAFCAVALLTASQLLLGYPQYVFYSLAVEASYVLLVAGVERSSWRLVATGLGKWLLAILLGALIGSVQLLPTFDALQNSVRQTNATGDFATQGSLPLLNLMQLLTPYLFATRVVGGITHEFSLYIGAVPFVLAVWWVVGGLPRNRQTNQSMATRNLRALSTAALITAGISLLWMMGELGPLGWLQEHVLLVNKFRLPCRAIVIFQLALAVLAGLGFADLISSKRPFGGEQISNTARQGSDRRQVLWVLPLASAIFTLIALRFWLPYVGAYPLVALGPLMIAVAVSLTLQALNGSRWAVAALVLFTAIDLGAYGMSNSVFGHTETFAKFISTIDTPPGYTHERVALDLASGAEAAPGQKIVRIGDQITLAGWKRVDGYAGLDPAKRLNYSDPAALRVAGTKWATADVGAKLQAAGYAGWMAKREQKVAVPSEPIVAFGKDTIWFRLADPQPRAWLVSRTITSENPATDITHILLAREALVDKKVTELESTAASLEKESVDNSASQTTAQEKTATETGTVSVTADRPGNISISVNCPTTRFLVVNESFHPGWQAAVDGGVAEVFRANGDFMGVIIPPGEHQISLNFQPKSLRNGRLASAFGLGLMVVLLATNAWSFRRRRQFQT